jgi:hypothetical protein
VGDDKVVSSVDLFSPVIVYLDDVYEQVDEDERDDPYYTAVVEYLIVYIGLI